MSCKIPSSRPGPRHTADTTDITTTNASTISRYNRINARLHRTVDDILTRIPIRTSDFLRAKIPSPIRIVYVHTHEILREFNGNLYCGNSIRFIIFSFLISRSLFY